MILDDQKRSQPNKGSTKRFVKKAIAFWVCLLIVFFILGIVGPTIHNSFGWIKAGRLINGLNGVILSMGIFGIPVIIVLSIGLRAIEKIIQRIE